MKKLILIKDHPELGAEGDLVEVADGYARNYLLPRSIALPATEHHIRMYRLAKEKQQRQQEKEIRRAEELGRRLSATSCTIAAAAGDEDRLFGSVSAADIAAALTQEGISLDRHQIKLEEPIKKLGIYSVPVKVADGVECEVKVWVVKE